MFMVFFTAAVLRQSSFRLLVFLKRIFYLVCLFNINVKKYIQSTFIPPTHESDSLIVHILQFPGALQEFMIKRYSSEY